MFYSEWFWNRLKERDALIPNPRNSHRLGKINLSPQNVDCIAFWTKNPIAMLDRLSELDAMGYAYYIQFTLLPYGKESAAKGRFAGDLHPNVQTDRLTPHKKILNLVCFQKE